MAPVRYSLHYEDYSEHLMSRFGKLLQIQSLVDMTLMCSSHTLRVHKTVLAASSAYFQEVLQKQTGEPLIILKMRFSVLKSLVEFMYCGKTQCLEENLDELVSAAQFLKIKGLSKVTKEGLGIANNTELPAFTPPVVISRPPQSLIDFNSQETDPKSISCQQMINSSSGGQSLDPSNRSNKDMVVRIPFDVAKSGANSLNMDYGETPRVLKSRRGRPTRSSVWETGGGLSRATERALMRRDQDSRKAMHQLKNHQNRFSQDYMDTLTLSQAVNSICDPESTTENYMNVGNDFMYMDQPVSTNVLDPTISFNKEHGLGSDAISSSYPATSTSEPNETGGIGSAMSQYVNTLKNAGLPTDLPILFESGDGSYIHVNEQVLLDMVQSSEIQYEVIEQPNIENVTDPSKIKSIDDLSKSIERKDMFMYKDYCPSTVYGKDYRHEDAINSLNALLPDSLESFADQQNYVVLNSRLPDNNAMSSANNDFSCIEGDMQYFTKSMSDDVKKYYQNQQLDDVRVIDQLCPTSTSLDPSFSISLLENKNNTVEQQFNCLNHDDLHRNDETYDFGLQLGQNNDLDCLMSTPKRNEESKDFHDNNVQERDEIIKDLMSIEKNMNSSKNHNELSKNESSSNGNKANEQDFTHNLLNVNDVFGTDNDMLSHQIKTDTTLSDVTSNVMNWDTTEVEKTNESASSLNDVNQKASENETSEFISDESRVIDLTDSVNIKSEKWDMVSCDMLSNKENFQTNINNTSMEPSLEDDIPFAVGLLPLKQVQPTTESSLLKRKSLVDVDIMNSGDEKCLKRKVKPKTMDNIL